MMPVLLFPAALPLALACLALAGCSAATTPPATPAPVKTAQADHDQGADHDHDHDQANHDHPDTIAAGLAELEKICRDVQEKLSAGDHDEADGKVHMVGHLLDDLRVLVADSKPAAEVETAAKQALDEIFECFDKMDTALHSADEDVVKKLDYAEHAPAIEAAIQKLKELVK